MSVDESLHQQHGQKSTAVADVVFSEPVQPSATVERRHAAGRKFMQLQSSTKMGFDDFKAFVRGMSGSSKDMASLRQAFDDLDEDKDGYIDNVEFCQLYKLDLQSPEEWDEDEVEDFLISRGFPEEAKTFHDQRDQDDGEGITGRIFMRLTEQDLRVAGIKKLGRRIKLAEEIRRLRRIAFKPATSKLVQIGYFRQMFEIFSFHWACTSEGKKAKEIKEEILSANNNIAIISSLVFSIAWGFFFEADIECICGVCFCACVRKYVCLCVCVRVCACVCACFNKRSPFITSFLHIHTHTHKLQTHTHTHGAYVCSYYVE